MPSLFTSAPTAADVEVDLGTDAEDTDGFKVDIPATGAAAMVYDAGMPVSSLLSALTSTLVATATVTFVVVIDAYVPADIDLPTALIIELQTPTGNFAAEFIDFVPLALLLTIDVKTEPIGRVVDLIVDVIVKVFVSSLSAVGLTVVVMAALITLIPGRFSAAVGKAIVITANSIGVPPVTRVAVNISADVTTDTIVLKYVKGDPNVAVITAVGVSGPLRPPVVTGATFAPVTLLKVLTRKAFLLISLTMLELINLIPGTLLLTALPIAVAAGAIIVMMTFVIMDLTDVTPSAVCVVVDDWAVALLMAETVALLTASRVRRSNSHNNVQFRQPCTRPHKRNLNR